MLQLKPLAAPFIFDMLVGAQVLPKRQQTKLLKSVAISVSFSMYCSESKLVVIASSLSNTVIQPYFVNDGVIARVPKFQVDLPGGSVDKPPKLTNTEVSVAVLYGQPYIFVIRNYPKTHVGHKADVTLYLVTREGCQKSHVLVLRENGRFMLNIVDNLVVVHSQPSRASYVFDIRSNAPSQSQRHTHAGRAGVFKQARSAFQTHFPIVSSTRIQPATIGVAPWQTHRLRDSSRTTIPVELYSRNWVAFHPNIIIDPSLGVLWRLRVLPSSLRHHMKEFDALVDVLVRRTNGHDVIIQVLREALDPRQRVNIAAAGRVFDIVNRACMKAQPAQPNTTHLVQYQNVSQLDVYVHLLSAIRETESMDNRTFVAVLLEYIRSLHEHDISVEHNVYDLLFAALVEDGRFYQLHQFLQYHVIDDDKYLACRLLSIKDQYQPALQLAMDMFKRLGDSQEEIFHVLLTQQQIVTAMHYLRELGPAVNIRTPGSRLLKAVQAMGDPSLFLSAFEFFQERRRKHPNDFGVGDFEGMAKQFAALQQQPSRSPSKPRPP
ncbi:hypothetical protein PTSG_07688 [Salpingoeca rosetta]|uniref:Mic1 domain-containing protein n=1 Tax=Salpingoeca rosetta (strain ATCC 50818 / BSB-021) TaxID=946362 RepID=F2UHH2_SALR5|nr:uncharacterized protein PTSG_07688 [Salpingoeca rosetta]EGD76571.1 hypothetical protein PTSG_07688 [Salpingoeca rosetta]|eukprot:XP_004991485.1 hypothetical protein PTSG_07688 [Salpingoeca rosetta]